MAVEKTLGFGFRGSGEFAGFGEAKIALPLLEREGGLRNQIASFRVRRVFRFPKEIAAILSGREEKLGAPPMAAQFPKRGSLRNERALDYGILATEKRHF